MKIKKSDRIIRLVLLIVMFALVYTLQFDIIFGFAELVAVYYLFYNFFCIFKAIKSRNWAPVKAKILWSDMHEFFKDNHVIITAIYNRLVNYEYVFNDESFVNNRVYWGQSHMIGNYRNFYNTYQPGDGITVYVNPANPKDSVINTDIQIANVIITTFWLIFILYTLYYYFMWRTMS